MKEAEAKRSVEESYLYDEEDQMATVYTPPVELNPKHHLKEKVN